MSRFLFVVISAVFCISFANGQGCVENGYFPNPSQCDAYTQCVNGTAIPGLCADGLVFNIPLYLSQARTLRCDFPFDIDCSSRPALQPAQPSEDCPRQWGLFSDPASCGKFIYCVEGKAYYYDCPEGLVFNDFRGVCDWPDLVDRCSNYLGFTCPAIPNELNVGHHPKYAHPNDCKRFFFCVDGLYPRLGVCADSEAFDDVSKSCRPAEEVRGCENYYRV